MPELPEVETTRRGIEPHILGQVIQKVIIRNRNLRWPIPARLNSILSGQCFTHTHRRAKYLLLDTGKGSLIIHLGMSGNLRITTQAEPLKKHDHLDICFRNGQCLRLHDPRRFGAVLWSTDPDNHKLIKPLGVEPLEANFTGQYLFDHSRKRTVAVKNFVMNSHIVVGIGNIYASEALFIAGIHPLRAAGKISHKRYVRFADAVKDTLRHSINSGGTTLRDFVNGEGKPGYFQQALQVYGKEGEPCPACKTAIRKVIVGQRSSFYCGHCQR